MCGCPTNEHIYITSNVCNITWKLCYNTWNLCNIIWTYLTLLERYASSILTLRLSGPLKIDLNNFAVNTQNSISSNAFWSFRCLVFMFEICLGLHFRILLYLIFQTLKSKSFYPVRLIIVNGEINKKLHR